MAVKKKTAKAKTPAKAAPKTASAKKAADKPVARKKALVKKPAATPSTASKPKTYTARPASGQMQIEQFFLNGPSNKSMETMMTQNKTQMDKAAQDAANFSRENTEAFMKFGQLFMKGFEDIMRETAALAQDSAEKQAQYLKEAMSTKTLNEWADVQNKMAQANFDDFMAGATKISELSVKVMTDSVEPFNAQMSEAMKKASSGMMAA